MDNLIFSLNATIPVFIILILGMIFKKLGFIKEDFASQLNKFVFVILLPVMLFKNLASVKLVEVWDTKFVIFCFCITFISIGISILISFLLKDKENQGEFIQAAYRSSASLLGVALINNIYPDSAMGPLMIIGSVPLYNIMAVVVLSVFNPQKRKLNKESFIKTIKEIFTNPIILGIIIGILWSLLKLPYPNILSKTVNSISNLATPLGLLAMGALFNYKQAIEKIKPSVIATFIKLIGFCAMFIPLAIHFCFTKEKLVAILIMLGSATTPSSFVMAKNMGHKGILTSNVVMLTILLCGFSITLWVFILRSFGLI